MSAEHICLDGSWKKLTSDQKGSLVIKFVIDAAGSHVSRAYLLRWVMEETDL